jgi:hypothetical protein
MTVTSPYGLEREGAMELDRIESKLFGGYWDDGLLDIFSGVAVLGVGIFWLADLVVLGAVAPAVLVPLWAPLRKAYVEPRAGRVEFSEARTHKTRRWLAGTIWLGIGTLLLFGGLYWRWATQPGDLLRAAIPGLPAVLISFLAVLTAVALGVPRFLGYAAILVTCGFGVAIAATEPGVAMAVGGLLILLIGARRFVRFLRLEVDEAVGS